MLRYLYDYDAVALDFSKATGFHDAPLDLSLKSHAPITPPSTPSPIVARKCKREPSPARTPPVTAPKRPRPKKQKATRKLNFDEDKSSPVSGTIIRDRSETVVNGDIDPIYNVVEVTEEAKAELAKIENRIGAYVCRLCGETYVDAFTLAQHRCSCIVHVEYRCPECDKVFNCPANLASHRRWHKPKPKVDFYDSSEDEIHIPCPICHKSFRKQTYLRKHLTAHHTEDLNDIHRSPPFAFCAGGIVAN